MRRSVHATSSSAAWSSAPSRSSLLTSTTSSALDRSVTLGAARQSVATASGCLRHATPPRRCHPLWQSDESPPAEAAALRRQNPPLLRTSNLP